MTEAPTENDRNRATAIALAVVAAATIGGPLLLGVPGLALHLGSLMVGYSLGFASIVALPGRRRALLFLAAGLFLATVCLTFLKAMGDLPDWRVLGESAWSMLFRVFSWFGIAVLITNHSSARSGRADRDRR